ncbi:hypothetical protein KJ765_05820 [Candidatus Micrarchaeota archaeon]|nr:hypothetical protein [Candidatus Micrarchaeota archaeon]
MRLLVGLLVIASLLLSGCTQLEEARNMYASTPTPSRPFIDPTPTPAPIPSHFVVPRLKSIPSSAIKMSPDTDEYPPLLHSGGWLPPEPLSSVINTAGAEDSAFVTSDGQTLYFWFTPDPAVPPHQQLTDGATGIYVSRNAGGEWQDPQRIFLHFPDNASLDGCPYVHGDTMWFCSARIGNYREVDMYTARFIEGEWGLWENVGPRLNEHFELGEMHLSSDGQTLYFHSPRNRGKGGYDLYSSRLLNGVWQEPEELTALNTVEVEGWPFLSEDGKELWFTRRRLGAPSIYRSLFVNGSWSDPELILSQFAAEPSLDAQGNIYFVHHFFKEGEMLDADIYVARKRGTGILE